MNRRVVALASVVSLAVAACSSDEPALVLPPSASTPSTPGASQPTTPNGSTVTTTSPVADDALVIAIDLADRRRVISPLILGMSGDLDVEQSRDVGLRFSSWGGNPSTRYNFEIGHAWNHGSDFQFRNTNYGTSGDVARSSARQTAEAGAEFRLAVPTIGWIARNDDGDTCSFPGGEDGCSGAEGSNCEQPDVVADPERANVRSSPDAVAAWVASMLGEGLPIGWIAMDNEPELWGYTHYDVHPSCTTFEEVLDTYLTYATAVDEVAPNAELMGPVACCWFDYWDIDPGPADGSDEDYTSWFLRNVREHDEALGRRTLDVLDVHYYPQSNVYNDDSDDETNARRLRSTRALWDPEYVDESWIGTPIRFIPRMLSTIERSYPGTKLAITEWNFGADTTINGALAIAEVLAVFGREGVDAAAYWRNPPAGSPGYFAFKLHGNYDGGGSSFIGTVVGTESDDHNVLSAFGALDDDAEVLRLMLINKDPERARAATLAISGGTVDPVARRWSYGPADLGAIVADTVNTSTSVLVPASSATLLELDVS